MIESGVGDPFLLIGKDIGFLARNASRHDHNVEALEEAGCWDTHTLCPTQSIQRKNNEPFNLKNLTDLVIRKKYGGVVLGSGFENDIMAWAKMGDFGRPLGCSLETVRKSRSAESLLRAAKAWNFSYPDVAYRTENLPNPALWLQKPFSSLGGRGIDFADKPLLEMGNGIIYQKYVNGIASSVSIVSDGSEAVILGITTQILGEEDFGATGFTYAGGVFPHPFAKELGALVANIADSLTLEYDLKGLWGFDFVYDGKIHLIEINPRPTLGLGLIDQATWNDLLGLHIDSVTKKYSNLIVDPGKQGIYFGRAHIYAKEETIFNGAEEWREQGACDIPFDGAIIRPGERIMTITSEANSHGLVINKLRNNAKRLYDSLQTIASPV